MDDLAKLIEPRLDRWKIVPETATEEMALRADAANCWALGCEICTSADDCLARNPISADIPRQQAVYAAAIAAAPPYEVSEEDVHVVMVASCVNPDCQDAQDCIAGGTLNGLCQTRARSAIAAFIGRGR